MEKLLLIVDDEEDVREFAANFFRRRKVNVSTASSGEEALRIMEKQRPELVLLDINMPDMDGVETLKRIKQKDQAIKVVMVTGKKPEDGESYNKCRELGALNYVHKPLEMDDLEKIVFTELF